MNWIIQMDKVGQLDKMDKAMQRDEVGMFDELDNTDG